MKIPCFGPACVLAAFGMLQVGTGWADDKPPGAKKADKKEPASVWMKKKLEYSRKILDGLTKADMALIENSAEAMQVVGYLEEWDRANLPEYKRQLGYFKDANKELIRQARLKNINGATLAYTQLTLSCVHCHNIIRDAKKK
jgi:hypothetical protein